MFFGTYTHTIDAKGRTALPAKLREALAAANEPRLVLMRNSLSRSMLALPQSAWTKVTENVMASSPFDAVAQRNVLKYVATAHQVDLDQSGRVLVPPELRGWAGLQKDVVWVGMGPYVILFDQATFEAEMERDVPPEERWDFFKGGRSGTQPAARVWATGEGGGMYETRHEETVTVIRGVGELSREELAGVAGAAARARRRGAWWSSI